MEQTGLAKRVALRCMLLTGGTFRGMLIGFGAGGIIFAATVGFTPAFAELGREMAVNPVPLFYAFQFGLDQYFFPYEGVMFLYLFTTGCVTLKHILPALGLRTVLTAVMIAAAAVPYWNMIGIM